MKLANTYNKLCKQIHALIRQRRAPRKALSPDYIQTSGLFKLDVDDDIWQDVGLDDDTDTPPPWLSDENVRNGIKALLALDRCMEEDMRLRKERSTMQEWMLEQWHCVGKALAVAGGHSILNERTTIDQ
jgi:hypothetical protein